MNYTEGQLLRWMAWLLRDHAEITSGAYKLRKTQQGVEGGGRDQTDEEKLRDAMATMTRRCDFIGKCVEKLGETGTGYRFMKKWE